MSKLYATVTSEKASKGQGGQKYLDIHVTSPDGDTIATIILKVLQDAHGDIIYAKIDFRDDIYVNGVHWIDATIKKR